MNIKTIRMTPRTIAILTGLFIIFVISIPLIEDQREHKEIKVYPERRQDTIYITKNKTV